MLYFSCNSKVVMQRLQDCIVRSSSVLYSEVTMEFDSNEEFHKFVEKWVDRYQLRLTPKQRFDLKAKGHPTFDLIIAPAIYTSDEFTKQMISLVKEDPQIFERDPDFNFLNATEYKLPIKFFLFCNIDSPKIHDGLIDISYVNQTLKKYVEGSEKFSYVFSSPITYHHYELIRLTQKKSIRDEFESSEKNAFDWTWRINANSFGKTQKSGQTLINRWNEIINKSEEEKNNYFEKHLQVLENYYGFRGVRKQVGTLWAKERALLKAKYGLDSKKYFRTLNLSYIQRLKSPLPSNVQTSAMIEHMQNVIKKSIH